MSAQVQRDDAIPRRQVRGQCVPGCGVVAAAMYQQHRPAGTSVVDRRQVPAIDRDSDLFAH